MTEGAASKPCFIFVYGTLRAGEINDLNLVAARLQLPAPQKIGQVTVKGRLYDFGNYPAFVTATNEQGDDVLGEVYQITESLIPALDEIEEVYPQQVGLFLKQYIQINIESNSYTCLIYPIDKSSVKNQPSITSGDWVSYRLQRKSHIS